MQFIKLDLYAFIFKNYMKIFTCNRPNNCRKIMSTEVLWQLTGGLKIIDDSIEFLIVVFERDLDI